MVDVVGLSDKDLELLQQRINSVVGQQKSKKSSIARKLLVTVVIALGLLSAATILLKNQEPQPVQSGPVMVSPEVKPEEPKEPEKPAEPVIPPDINGPKIDSLTKKVQELDLRTWMLSIVVNENAHVSRETAPIGSGMGSKYIQFDKNWKLSKMPEYLSISEKDRKRLADLVKEQPTEEPNP